MPVVRSASLKGFAPLVTRLGGNPERLAEQAGLPVAALYEDELLIDLEPRSVVLELAAEQLDCQDLGLRLGDTQQLDGLGSLAVAIRHSPNLADALDCARRFLTLHNQGSSLELVDDPYEVRGVVGLRFVWHHEGRAYPQSMDKTIVNVHRVMQALAGGDYGLRSVELSYRPAAPLSRHAELFDDVRINIDRPLTMLRIPLELLARPVAGADSAIREMAMFYLSGQAQPIDLTYTQIVRTALDALLGTGRISLRWVAQHLETTTRTLQRRLTAEHTTLGALLDEARRDKALVLLAETDMSLAEVAAMLDFTDQATLSRAARRWWDETPTQRRARSRRD